MKKIWLMMLVNFCGWMVLGQSAFVENKGIMEKMTKAATEVSVSGLTEVFVTNNWKCPPIYSKWNLDNKQRSMSEREKEDSVRTFGLAMARRLDEWAIDMLAQTNTEVTANNVRRLLTLADWIAGSEGYGNLILASRCHDIASVGLGRLVVDLEFPFDAVSSLVACLDAPWRSLDARVAVLNKEVGSALFTKSSSDRKLAQKQVEETWENGVLTQLKRRNIQGKAVSDATKVAGYKAVTQTIAVQCVKLKESEDSNVQDFFSDDDISQCPRPMTTVSTWGLKQHRKLVIGSNTANIRYLKALLTFRKFVKKFPQRIESTPELDSARIAESEIATKNGISIVSFESSYMTPVAAAFAKSWRPYETSDTRNLDATAWQAYNAVISGQFVDEDTRERRVTDQINGGFRKP